MGAVRPRAIALTGSDLRPHAPKLSVVWSFISIAILRTTFLTNHKLHYACYFFYMRCQHNMSAACLSSGSSSDFRRMF